MRFSKMHGAGNDFVVLDLRGGHAQPSAALCRHLGDRHFGVGCDQILTISEPRSPQAVAAYGIWNSDGSAAGQCGNGARCVAAWLLRDGAARGERFVIESPADLHTVDHMGGTQFRIGMGVPRWRAADVPYAGQDEGTSLTHLATVTGRAVEFSIASLGNPHAVIEVDDVASAAVDVIGPALQASPLFPQSVNVGFAQVLDRGHLRLRVYERGAGETLACGSGACAAAVVLMRRGRVDREVDVALPGGTLRIGWPDDAAEVTMTGPAVFVFEGELDATALSQQEDP